MNDENRLPKSAYRYFWEIDPAQLDVSAHPRYVIERLLEYGDFPELRWLFRRFPREQIVDTLKRSRQLSRRRAAFWALYFDVPSHSVRCLQKPFHQQRDAIWPY
ncbi:MAG: hypothetical protein D6803_00280 [Anaerolineae bacterium]|nr:MAG: hypothetical protein D6803_00280 [Anaerolineae bacterium]